jgi:very-short-patch-repair endonuclease
VPRAGFGHAVRVLDAADVVRRLGGRATFAEVTARASRAALRRAVAGEALRRVRRGVYALPDLPAAHTVAAATRGVVSHTTAARALGLEVALPDDAVHVTVAPGTRPPRRRSVVVHWSPLPGTDVDGPATTPLRTVLDCARTLPFPQGLAVADSAVRGGLVSLDELATAARSRHGAGRAAGLEVAAWADGRARNGFESVLRGTLVEAGIADLVPQLRVRLPRFTVHVDLGDAQRMLVVEADSYTHHGTRRAFGRDCERYDELAAAGWLVLRFTWEQVMFDPDWVVDVVRRARGRRRRRPA